MQLCRKINDKLPDLIDIIRLNKYEIIDSFFHPLSNSNFRLLKCYKSAFDFGNFFTNIGRIIMSLLFIGLIANFIIYIIKDRKKINEYFDHIIKNKEIKENTISDGTKKLNLENKKIKISSPIKKKTKKQYSSSLIINKESKDNTRNKKSLSSRIEVLNKKNKLKLSNKKVDIYKKKKKTFSFSSKEEKKKLNNKEEFEELELNNLDYILAIKSDKRTFSQYYWSLLKKKQLILFVFLPVDDYNLLSLKISLFLLSFSLYFTINGFFFNDDTMHKIYIENGAFNFIYQLPATLFSTIISALINLLLKALAITEKKFYEIKKEKDKKIAIGKSKVVDNLIKKKIIIFFVISLILMLFLWYFISCFCSIYHNTQIILIKDTLITFSLSMLYPFGLNLLPALLRISALKAEKKDKEILYKISKIVSLI